MDKVKFQLVAAPTFDAAVEIPVAGGAVSLVRFTFRHRTKDALAEWIKSEGQPGDIEIILDMAVGWELEEPLDAASVGILVQNYAGASRAILRRYVEELTAARLGN